MLTTTNILIAVLAPALAFLLASPILLHGIGWREALRNLTSKE